MGKAMHGTAGAGQADPAPAGDLGGLRPWRMLPEEFELWQHRLDRTGYDKAAVVEQ